MLRACEVRANITEHYPRWALPNLAAHKFRNGFETTATTLLSSGTKLLARVFMAGRAAGGHRHMLRRSCARQKRLCTCIYCCYYKHACQARPADLPLRVAARTRDVTAHDFLHPASASLRAIANTSRSSGQLGKDDMHGST